MSPPARKRVEFSPALGPIDPQAPPSPGRTGPAWDTETDHILSYFLGGDGSHVPMPEFTLPDPVRSRPEPPPTPAVQHFYSSMPVHGGETASASNPGATLTSNSSSSSSLSSMTQGAFPMFYHSMQVASAPSQSPISPAAMIGPGVENLMLPPPPRNPQEQHMAWLRDINAMAKAHSSSKPQESQEKREKRLERNRESARKSRRRKKERLATLEAQVNGLHAQIGDARTQALFGMVEGLRQARHVAIGNPETPPVLALRTTGPQSPIAQAALEFQYATLKQNLLPTYQNMLHWFAVQDESFFSAGKTEWNASHKQVVRASAGRASSKQIGEEIFKKADTGPGVNMESGERAMQTAYAKDAPRMWPLVCYELSFSVDQEERFLAAYKRVKQNEGLKESREEVTAMVKTADRLRLAIESISKVVSEREERVYVNILTPEQTAKYQTWLEKNRESCRGALGRRSESPPLGKDASLHYICDRLNEVLQISKNER